MESALLELPPMTVESDEPGDGKATVAKQIRFDNELAQMAKFVASETGISMVEYLASICRERIQADYEIAAENLKRRATQPKRTPKKG